MDKDQERAIEFVGSLLKFYGDYRSQKEREAYVVTVLFFGATGVLLTSGPPAAGLFRRLVAIGVTVAAVLVPLLVCWQLRNLRFAARMVGACVTVSSRWLATSPDANARSATVLSGYSVEVPHDVAREFSKQCVCGVAVALVAIPILIGLWGLAIAWVLWFC